MPGMLLIGIVLCVRVVFGTQVIKTIFMHNQEVDIYILIVGAGLMATGMDLNPTAKCQKDGL